jgi:hypothetical protein
MGKSPYRQLPQIYLIYLCIGSTGDTISIVFGIVGTIIAVGTFWVTRHTTRRPIGKSHFAKRTLFSENIELINFSNRYCTRFRVRSRARPPQFHLFYSSP